MNRYSRRNSIIKSMPKPKKRGETMGEKNVRSTTRGSSRPVPRPHETEEEAIVRRYHDAQRMARFRAKRKKALEEAQALEASKLTEMAVLSEIKRRNIVLQLAEPIITVPSPRTGQLASAQNFERNPMINVSSVPGQSKYSQLLGIIEELGKDIRLAYAGSRTSAERLKIGIAHANSLVRDCLLETEINAKQ